ncbi:M16 family metallopeptidase [Aurantiacibacter gangjinensis]|uniref:Peptidase M16 n=1 Tax=Aurantiacibacter gangjinensis TaxID=502682 RepID=A0A0G9MMP0_9SPHN|nr:pitrilysin family protein [Aurantiacibacter gangjinensis]APE27928.1 putative peptidase [Aurantiacibacter gangjinensis]KLE31879.1 peptidase M16 [Aurantiacibacter gangjinensis]
MTFRFLATSAVALALCATQPAFAQDAADTAPALTAPEIDFTEWTLDNGLRVIAVQDDTTATVTTSLWYEIGSKLDPEGRSGFAHLFEHILSRKTVNMPYNMIYDLTADVGGTRNASNGTDRTNYFETVPAQYLETMLWTHRERMAFPVVDDEVFETERNVVKEEYRTRVLAPPYGLFQRVVLPEITFDRLPHRRPGIGSIEDLDAATLDDARAFHQAYYGPDTATLIVAGNFEIDNLRALVDEYFGDIPPRANPVDVAITIREQQRTQPRMVEASAPNVALPLVGTVWQLPEATHPDTAAIEVLDMIMSSGQNSRLYRALIESSLAVGTVQYAYQQEEGGQFVQYARVAPDADFGPVAAALAAETARVREEPVTEAELAEAKNEIIASTLRRRETARGRAFELGEALVSTGNPRAADMRLEAIANVTIADVQRVAQTWLDPQARTDFTLTRGEFDPASFANPAPMPTFRTLPAPVGEPLAVLPEAEREAPPGPGAVPVVETPDFVTRTLANGIEVLAVQTGDVPIATMSVLLPGGSVSDSREKAGVASFAAALAEQGTTTRSAAEIAARLESLGASMGGGASTDRSGFTLTAPVANMEAAGEILSDVIRNPVYPEDILERDRARALNGLRNAMNEPGALARMALSPVLYGDAPYGNNTGGTLESIASITRDDLLRHQQTYWHPSRAQIVVSGGIAPEQAFALAEELFGDWQSETPVAPMIQDRAGPALQPRTVVIDMPDAGQAAVYLVGRAPEVTDDAYYPLVLANAVLGGGSSGRLFEEIRTNRALSYGSYSGIAALAESPFLQASAQTANETVDEVVEVMLNEFERIGSEPLADELLDRRRLYLTGGYERSLESSSGYAGQLANLLTLGVDPSEIGNYADYVNAVTAEQASAAAARYFDPDAATLIVVGNADAFVQELRELRDDVEVIPADQLDLDTGRARMGG